MANLLNKVCSKVLRRANVVVLTCFSSFLYTIFTPPLSLSLSMSLSSLHHPVSVTQWHSLSVSLYWCLEILLHGYSSLCKKKNVQHVMLSLYLSIYLSVYLSSNLSIYILIIHRSINAMHNYVQSSFTLVSKSLWSRTVPQ